MSGMIHRKCPVLLFVFAAALLTAAGATAKELFSPPGFTGSLLDEGDDALTKKPFFRYDDAIAGILPKTGQPDATPPAGETEISIDELESATALEKAATLYLKQYQARSPRSEAAYARIDALCQIVRKVLALPENELQAAAASPVLRPLVTAHLLSDILPSGENARPAQELARTWSRALDAAGTPDSKEALRLALLSYRQDEFVSCIRRLQTTPATAPLAGWLTARLLIREGRIKEAADLLAEVVEKNALKAKIAAQSAAADFDAPPVSPWRYERQLTVSENGVDLASRIVAEHGALSLARQNYAEALDCFLRCEIEDDAAYVAEYVMTTGELQKYVDAAWPDLAEKTPENGTRIRHILAKRLMRERRWQDARPYFPQTALDVYDQYVADVQQAYNESLSAELRAAGFWRAAANVRDNGRALFAAEVGPIWTADRGWLEIPVPQPARCVEMPVSSDEAARVASRTISKEDRDHRYRAAELASYAAALLPNDDERTALILATAGVWLKNRDPRAAEPFYKMLAIRCAGTPLGKSVNALHWFPPEITGTVAGVWPDAPRAQKNTAGNDAPAQPAKM